MKICDPNNSDDAQIVVDDYVEQAEVGGRDLSPDALLQIPNDDIGK